MRRWWWVAVGILSLACCVLVTRWVWFRGEAPTAKPLPVPSGDQEIAWLHNPTAFESWENFVRGVKRAQLPGEGGVEGLEVDDSGAYPEKTTAVPEVVIRRKGFTGSLHIRWYKVTDEASQEAWITALAARNPAPLAVFGGWSSDRAKELAYAMRDANWSGSKPLLFLATATADAVYRQADNYPADYVPPQLIAIYDQSFRLCFTNRQMASAVTDFVFSDPLLRPGPVVWPGLSLVAGGSGGGWTALPWAAALAADPMPLPAFAISWEDDDYSIDLNRQFRAEIGKRAELPGNPRLAMMLDRIPFSVGGLNRPNAREAAVVEQILCQLPPPGHRSLLVIPTVSSPARRTLRTLLQGEPDVGRRLVAVNGDGIGVNTIFRDGEFAWPVRSLQIPVVFFTHADPLGWDRHRDGPPLPADLELRPPEPGGVRSSTEDVKLFTRSIQVIAAGVFRDGAGQISSQPEQVAAGLRGLSPPFFDEAGNRRSGTGEHVVVLRPAFPGDGGEARLEVYQRPHPGSHWSQVHVLPLPQYAVSSE